MYAKMKKLQAKTRKMSTFSNREEKRRVKKKLLRVVVRVKTKKALSVTFGLTQK